MVNESEVVHNLSKFCLSVLQVQLTDLQVTGSLRFRSAFILLTQQE